MVKYDINRLYEANITISRVPDYAPNANFIGKSKESFIFLKEENKYIEVFTEQVFDKTADNVALAKHSGILVCIKQLPQNTFKKHQRKKGVVSKSEITPIYRRINTEEKKLIKTRIA